jgi:hypothetical protein
MGKNRGVQRAGIVPGRAAASSPSRNGSANDPPSGPVVTVPFFPAALTRLLIKAIKDAKAKPGPGKRFRAFLCPEQSPAPGADRTGGARPGM